LKSKLQDWNQENDTIIENLSTLSEEKKAMVRAQGAIVRTFTQRLQECRDIQSSIEKDRQSQKEQNNHKKVTMDNLIKFQGELQTFKNSREGVSEQLDNLTTTATQHLDWLTKETMEQLDKATQHLDWLTKETMEQLDDLIITAAQRLKQQRDAQKPFNGDDEIKMIEVNINIDIMQRKIKILEPIKNSVVYNEEQVYRNMESLRLLREANYMRPTEANYMRPIELWNLLQGCKNKGVFTDGSYEHEIKSIDREYDNTRNNISNLKRNMIILGRCLEESVENIPLSIDIKIEQQESPSHILSMTKNLLYKKRQYIEKQITNARTIFLQYFPDSQDLLTTQSQMKDLSSTPKFNPEPYEQLSQSLQHTFKAIVQLKKRIDEKSDTTSYKLIEFRDTFDEYLKYYDNKLETFIGRFESLSDNSFDKNEISEYLQDYEQLRVDLKKLAEDIDGIRDHRPNMLKNKNFAGVDIELLSELDESLQENNIKHAKEICFKLRRNIKKKEEYFYVPKDQNDDDRMFQISSEPPRSSLKSTTNRYSTELASQIKQMTDLKMVFTKTVDAYISACEQNIQNQEKKMDTLEEDMKKILRLGVIPIIPQMLQLQREKINEYDIKIGNLNTHILPLETALSSIASSIKEYYINKQIIKEKKKLHA